MRFAVGAYEPRAVDPEHDLEILKTYVVQELIEAPLQERGINAEHGDRARDSHARRHCYGVLFGYADVEETVRELPLEG